jgi:hypothetical protein
LVVLSIIQQFLFTSFQSTSLMAFQANLNGDSSSLLVAYKHVHHYNDCMTVVQINFLSLNFRVLICKPKMIHVVVLWSLFFFWWWWY